MAEEPTNVRSLEGTTLPAVVQEAEAVLHSHRKTLWLTGGGWGALWLASHFVVFLPLSFLLIPLAGIGALGFFPVTRRGRWAKEVIGRWEDIRIDRAFDRDGASSDPLLEAAHAMAERVLNHASADQRLRRVVEALLAGIRQAVNDTRTIELVRRSERTLEPEDSTHRATGERGSDVRQDVEHKIARLLMSLREMYEAVIGHDAAALGSVLDEAESMIGRLLAEQEVEVMLHERG